MKRRLNTLKKMKEKDIIAVEAINHGSPGVIMLLANVSASEPATLAYHKKKGHILTIHTPQSFASSLS